MQNAAHPANNNKFDLPLGKNAQYFKEVSGL